MSEVSISPPPPERGELKPKVDFSQVKKPDKIADNLNTEKPENFSNLNNAILGDLQTASIERQVKEITEGDKKIERPQISQFESPAFFLEPPVRLSAGAMINYINLARQNGIIINATEEGTKFVGYFDNAEKLELLQKMGNVSVGLPSAESPSLIHIDHARQVSIQGSGPVLTAARMEEDGKTNMAGRLVHEPTNRSRPGKKGTHIEPTDFSAINYGSYPQDLPKEAFAQIEKDQVKTHYFDEIFAVKVDVNDFGPAFTQATRSGQIELDQELILFFNGIDKKLKETGILLGEQTTDSLTFYLTDFKNRGSAEEILFQAIQESSFSIKAVAERVPKVELTEVEGRVIHSTRPVEHDRWSALENGVKRKLRGKSIDERKKIESSIHYARAA